MCSNIWEHLTNNSLRVKLQNMTTMTSLHSEWFHPQTVFLSPGLVNCLFHFYSSAPECWHIVLLHLTSLNIAFHEP